MIDPALATVHNGEFYDKFFKFNFRESVMDLELVLWIAGAYLLGAIPFGVVVAKVLGGRDPRTVGSGNIGATNVSRALGKKAGVATLLLDAAKGFAPVFAAAALFKGGQVPALVGLAAFLGHLFPVYLRFKGGKGVATAAGVFLACAPWGLALSALAFGLIVWRTRWVSLGSMVSAALLPVFSVLLGYPPEYAWLGAAVAVLTIIKHCENIKRLIAGNENRFGERA